MSKSILLCDDELHIVRATEFKFKRNGFDVRTACDGEEAWEAICERKPDILITDCQMPRLDGISLAHRIRSNPETAGMHVVMLTAKGFELSRDELAARYGVLAMLAKPFSPRELVRVVEQILETGKYEETTFALNL